MRQEIGESGMTLAEIIEDIEHNPFITLSVIEVMGEYDLDEEEARRVIRACATNYSRKVKNQSTGTRIITMND